MNSLVLGYVMGRLEPSTPLSGLDASGSSTRLPEVQGSGGASSLLLAFYTVFLSIRV